MSVCLLSIFISVAFNFNSSKSSCNSSLLSFSLVINEILLPDLKSNLRKINPFFQVSQKQQELKHHNLMIMLCSPQSVCSDALSEEYTRI